MTRPPPVTFFYPYPDDLAQLDAVELDDWRFWSETWRERRRAWSLRTYLCLKQAGHEVAISATPPEQGTVVIGPEMKMRRAFLSAPWRQRRNVRVVAIRADLPRCTFADAEIVQNGFFHDGDRIIHIPHWPQPGLVPRDPNRGTNIRNIAFKGYAKNLHDVFSSPTWATFTDKHNVELQAATEKGGQTGDPIRWHDYQEADLVLALRPDLQSSYVDKPASKLFNAWHAGVPALLGPEIAFREWRESELDYIEVSSLSDVMKGIESLIEHPDRYQAMVEHGKQRAQEVTRDTITERWAQVLFEKIPARQSQTARTVIQRLPTPVQRIANILRMPPSLPEIAFTARWTYNVLEYEINGRLRPWLGQWKQSLFSS